MYLERNLCDIRRPLRVISFTTTFPIVVGTVSNHSQNKHMRVVQANPRQIKEVSTVLTKVMGEFDVDFIQEPWGHSGQILCLGGIRRELIYNRTSEVPRKYIIIRKGINMVQLSNFWSRDLTVVRLKTTRWGGFAVIIFVSAYFPYDNPEPPPTRKMKVLLRARRWGPQLIMAAMPIHTTRPVGKNQRKRWVLTTVYYER